MNNNQTGKCQCGSVSYSFNKEKLISSHHCHCKDCQRATGSGKATILFISKKYVELNGEIKYFETKGSSGSHVRRGFCPNCGSGILSYTKELPHILFIKAGTLDNSSWVKIDSNFFTKSANDWNKPDESIKCFEGNPGIMYNLKTLIKSF
jgi:hypothetical protein|tara:strand:+ start:403 stop:852 length:450 start_codon:yes stop_codon:yes gene_type:complete